MISHCSWPAQHGQPTTTKLLLPTYQCQVVTGQLNTANSLQGKLTVVSQRERQAGRRASRWAEHRLAVARTFHFHTPLLPPLPMHWVLGHSEFKLFSSGGNVQAVQGRWWRPDVPHFYSSCHHCHGGPLSVGAVWGQWWWVGQAVEARGIPFSHTPLPPAHHCPRMVWTSLLLNSLNSKWPGAQCGSSSSGSSGRGHENGNPCLCRPSALCPVCWPGRIKHQYKKHKNP